MKVLLVFVSTLIVATQVVRCYSLEKFKSLKETRHRLYSLAFRSGSSFCEDLGGQFGFWELSSYLRVFLNSVSLWDIKLREVGKERKTEQGIIGTQ